jgi:MYXO-CTERM domain-containing protein
MRQLASPASPTGFLAQQVGQPPILALALVALAGLSATRRRRA